MTLPPEPRPPKAPRLPKVALVGRPNVGKSSLFNRLLGRKEAIVLDRPGVTRDRIERTGRLASRMVLLQDTGGIVPEAQEELYRQVTRQALTAIEEADVVVFIVDGRAGVTPLDLSVAEILRPAGVPVLVAVNKIDTPAREPEAAEAWDLGLGEPWPVSAEHGVGIEPLAEAIEALLPPAAPGEADYVELDARPDPSVELHVAIVGRPNVGKSSLVNRLAGEERVTVSPVPGTTRDAVDVVLTRDGRQFRLVDTAGLRRRAKTASADEDIGILFTRRRLARCHVAVLVLDAVQGPTTQDAAIAGEIHDAGRPLVIALNKWDLVPNPEERVKELDRDIERRFAFVANAPRVTVSALSGQRAFKVLDYCRDVALAAGKRVTTSELNRFLAGTIGELVASAGATPPRTLYITQTGSLPPRFVIFVRDTGRIDAAFRRFFERRLREAFEFGPTPISLEFRSTRDRRE
jgi:GTP-binding protein